MAFDGMAICKMFDCFSVMYEPIATISTLLGFNGPKKITSLAS